MRHFWQNLVVFLVRDHILTLTLALIGSGAEQSFIDQTLAKELGLLLITLNAGSSLSCLETQSLQLLCSVGHQWLCTIAALASRIFSLYRLSVLLAISSLFPARLLSVSFSILCLLLSGGHLWPRALNQALPLLAIPQPFAVSVFISQFLGSYACSALPMPCITPNVHVDVGQNSSGVRLFFLWGPALIPFTAVVQFCLDRPSESNCQTSVFCSSINPLHAF